MTKAQPSLPWSDFYWHKPQNFAPLAIGLIVASASAAAVFCSGLWLSAARGSSFGWGTPWVFLSLFALLSFGVARSSLGRAAANLFYLLGPLAWIVSALFWGNWTRGEYFRGVVVESIFGFFVLGAVCARIAGLPTTRDVVRSITSFEEKSRELCLCLLLDEGPPE